MVQWINVHGSFLPSHLQLLTKKSASGKLCDKQAGYSNPTVAKYMKNGRPRSNARKKMPGRKTYI